MLSDSPPFRAPGLSELSDHTYPSHSMTLCISIIHICDPYQDILVEEAAILSETNRYAHT